ncbi:MAG TPA: VacJ family lipoprotein [Steroidobacteraceae bacterium]|nr:VacJ family lipoprotein [Steroidobacteraceae bacterium]
MSNKRPALAVLGLMAATALSACVTLPPNAPRSRQDPFERWNRGVYNFNDVLDRHVAKPVARTYVRVVPHPVRTGVSNFFANLDTPTVMINDALQGQFRSAANDLGRFLLDSTVGLGGLLDPATQIGMDRNDADFGETLGVWGMHPGPFLELPLLGPSDMRDGPARVVDAYTNPAKYVTNTDVTYGLLGLDLVKTRASLLPLDATLKNAFDPYAFIRNAFLQHRAYMIAQVKDSSADDSPSENPGNDRVVAKPAGGKP